MVLDEAWLYLADSLFAGKIREWLKVLRKQNVAVVFATQSLSDVADSPIAAAIVENCLTRIFLPNAAAPEERTRKVYESFGLNERQLQILQQAIPKRDYYYQSRDGNRLFELGLGPLQLAFCAAGAPEDHARLTRLLGAHGRSGFLDAYLHELGLGHLDGRDVTDEPSRSKLERSLHHVQNTTHDAPIRQFVVETSPAAVETAGTGASAA